VPAGFGLYQAVTQRDDVAQVLDACLRDIDANRTDEAFARFSSRAVEHQLVTREQVERLAGTRPFEDYQSLSVTGIHVSKTFNTDPKTPQGTVARASGSVAYQGGDSGVFQATLEKEGDQWRIFSINVQRSDGPANKAKPLIAK
jgi:hypothetical protein